MEVFEHEQQRRDRGTGGQPLADGVEHLAARRAVRRDRGRRESRRQLWRQPQQGVDAVAGEPSQLGVVEPDGVVDDRLAERAVGLIDVLVARAEQDVAAADVDLARHLGDESALADAGLTAHDCEDGVAGAGQRPVLAQRIALTGPTDEGGFVGQQL